MTTGPAPAYVDGPPSAAAHALGVRARLASLLDDRMRALAVEVAASIGGRVADDAHQTQTRVRRGEFAPSTVVTFEVPGAGTVDVTVGPWSVHPTVPPGWDDVPAYQRGDVVAVPGGDGDGPPSEAVVVAVLGDADDPRPGYRCAAIGRTQTGTLDPSALGPTRTVGHRIVEGSRGVRMVGTVELPDGAR